MTDPFVQKVVVVALALWGVAFACVLVATPFVRDRGKLKRLWLTWLFKMVPIAAVVGPALVGPGPLALAILVIVLIGTREVLGALELIGHRPHRSLAQAGGVAAVLCAAAFGPPGLYGAALISFVLALVLAWGRAGRATGTALAIVYPSLLLSHVLLLANRPGGVGLLLFIYCLLEVNDGFAFFLGYVLGRHKIWPRLSPGKTFEGSLAGLLATMATATQIGFAVPTLDLTGLLLAGAAIAIVGQAGDLLASAIKRRAGVKDFARLIPTRGGVMDVYDALTLTAPLCYVATILLGV